MEQAIIDTLTSTSITATGSFQAGEFDEQADTPVARLYDSIIKFYRGSEINPLAQIGLNLWDSSDDKLHLSAFYNGTGVQIDYGAGSQGTLVAYEADFSDFDPTTGDVSVHNNFYGDITLNGTDLFELIYPVGSIYLSVNSTSPATLFGGTWTQIQDTFLLAAGSTYSAGATGGEATHKLTVAEMPSHSHNMRFLNYNRSSGGNVSVGQMGSWITSGYILAQGENAGGGAAHNNLPPYLVVYMWQRTA